jgi:hypothetical protein
MSAPQSSIGDQPGSVPRLRAVSDDLGFDVTDLVVGVFGRTVEAKVVDLTTTTGRRRTVTKRGGRRSERRWQRKKE